MKIELIAAGTKPPGWVREGFDTYQGRMKGDCELVLKEYPVAKRHKTGSIARYAKEEERTIRDLMHPRALVIALDKSGKYIAFDDPDDLQGVAEIGKRYTAQKFIFDKVSPYYEVLGWNKQPLENALNGVGEVSWI